MAGGPIFPHSVYPVDTVLFPTFLTAEMPEGLGFPANCDDAKTWRLFFRTPSSLPTGTAKLLLACHANATTGNANIVTRWKSYGANEVPATADLISEGATLISFATTAYRETQAKITLDADTIVAGELIMLEIVSEDTAAEWTLAANLAIQTPCIIWEA